MRIHPAVLGLLIGASLTACTERDRTTEPRASSAPAPAVAPSREATTTVSDLAPKAGNVIVVAVTIGMDDSLSIGSFQSRLFFDRSMLTYLGATDADDVMRVINPEPGRITVAAATSAGSKTGRLFTFRFRVDDPTGLHTLRLSLDALYDARFVSRLSSVVVAPELRLDSSLAMKRVKIQ